MNGKEEMAKVIVEIMAPFGNEVVDLSCILVVLLVSAFDWNVF